MMLSLAGDTAFDGFLIGYGALILLGFVIAGAPLFVAVAFLIIKWWRTLAAKRRANNDVVLR
ncbi:MAG: hypothetical protein MSG64_03400 [Pyrinomonadaceae bacterium MAG19_C2-C3]|nr:hypothetical protein [Pyrinomonadaceae bacterium MAG19_C2-C3]